MSREWTVPDALGGKRLDVALRDLEPTLSRARIKQSIDRGAVRVNGRRLAKGALVSAGDVISLVMAEVSDRNAPAVPTRDAPLSIVLETPDVILVNKPAGVPTAPLKHGEIGTLANALVGHYPELANVGYSPREPGLVHRLDNATSGLVLVARNKSAFDLLARALKEGEIEKKYLLVCLAEGLADEGTVEFPIANHPKDHRRVYPCVHPRDVMRYAPRPASTKFRVVERHGRYALVEATVSKALRHQIRAHFAAMDHPLVGDVLYGGEPIEGGGARHALHASYLAYAGAALAAFSAEVPLPADLRALLVVST